MDNFPKIKASKQSLAQRKLVKGVGINDSWFHVNPKINGKKRIYKPYSTWSTMLQRCYSDLFQEKYQTYIGCTVCDDWHLFSNFEEWMLTQEFDGKEMDKDLVKQGNKIYCPEYCRFISKSLNSLLLGNDASRGDYPMGVSWYKQTEKYQARIRINGKLKHLGYFKTVQEAKAVYDKAKYAEIHRHAMLQDDLEIRAGLMNWVVE